MFSTDKLRGIADIIIKSDDDAVSLINSAPSESIIWIEPGSSFTQEETLTPPYRGALLSHGGRIRYPAVEFTKEFDGSQMEIPSGLAVSNIRLNGNKSNGYTGDGAVDGSAGTNECHFRYFNIVN